MIILSVDYGDTRTGIAVCDKTEFLASPVTVITEKETEPLIEKITDIAREKKAELIVVGLPVNMDGTRGDRAGRHRRKGYKSVNSSEITRYARHGGL